LFIITPLLILIISLNNKISKKMITRQIAIIRNLFCVYQAINVDHAKLSKFEARNFADQVKLTLVAGSGGSGSTSYFADKRVRRGQPDGGCGGKGGDIII
jgi:hypothetical protein